MNEGKEMIPNWTGFHYEVTSKLNDDIDEVFYLPAINQSPTKLETVQEVLYQVKSKSQAIGLQCSNLVLDHAIYSKALEILQNPNYIDLKQLINLRLGGFHVCLNFLAVIGTRFASAGMTDIIIESDLLGPGSLNSVIMGNQYNRGMSRAEKIGNLGARFPVFLVTTHGAPQKVYLRNHVAQRAPKNHSPKLCFLYVKSSCFGTLSRMLSLDRL